MNRKEALALVEKNSRILASSKQDFAAIYEIMFGFKDEVLLEGNDGFRIYRYTYGEIKKEIEKISASLHKRIGATHAYVGIEMENCKEWIVAFWAILRSGNKPYLINCRHPKNLADNICKSLEIRYIIGLVPTELSAEYLDFSSLSDGGDSPFDGEFENEIALSTSATSLNGVVCFYSGQEFAKQILNTESIMAENRRISQFYHKELKLLAFLPFYHIFGLAAVYFWFTFFGRTLVLLRDYAPDTILQTIRKHEVTHIFGVPMLWHTIEKEIYRELKKQGEKQEKKFWKGLRICTNLQNAFPYLGAKLSKKIMGEVTEKIFGESVQFCISGGSYIKKSALELFNGLGYSLHNGYGMSEIGITSVELRDKPKERNLGSVGHPMKSVEYKISETGTLLVRGDSICKAVMINGKCHPMSEWFDTGDVMTCDENGCYYINGRMGDVVIGENGENINPDVMEQEFFIPDALCFSILGLSKSGNVHDRTDEELSMIICIHKFLSVERVKQMMENVYQINGKFPLTAQIKKFYFTYDALAPATAIKVGRNYVKRGLENGTIHLISFGEFMDGINREKGEPVSMELHGKVCSVIADTLGLPVEEVQEDSHILSDLGASSLEYFSIIQELIHEFGLEVQTENEEFKYTVREICEYIETHI